MMIGGNMIDTNGKRVLDPCCGSRMFWFDKNNQDVIYCDNRKLHTTLCDGRKLDIDPDVICDVTDLPFDDNSFWHVVFDPPHMNTLGESSWMAQKYGTLKKMNWETLIHDGFWECMRVLKPNGTLIFKWNEQDITVSNILSVIGVNPMYGHKSGKLQKTHWMAFMKSIDEKGDNKNEKENSYENHE